MGWGIVLGLGASLGWGVSSFLAGQQARRLSPLLVTIWSQIIGGVVLLLVLLLSGTSPTLPTVGWGLLAGLFGSSALVLFYQSMVLGQVSLVTPIVSCSVLVPLLVGLVRGEPLGWRGLLGIVLVLAGIVLVSLRPGARRQAASAEGRSLLYAFGAALSFGLSFVLVDQGAAGSSMPLWVTLSARTGGLTLLLVVQLLHTGRLPVPDQQTLRQLGTIGLVDTTGTALFTVATLAPSLGVVTVLASLYPVVTIVLSRLFLAERLSTLQYSGVGLTLAGITLLALP